MALENHDHELFCQAVFRRVSEGEKRAVAIVVAYRETMYRGENPNDAALAPNARRLANSPLVKARIARMLDNAATLAECDAGWGMVKLKKVVDEADAYTLDNYMARDADGKRRNLFDLSEVSNEHMKSLTEITTEVTVSYDAEGKEVVRSKIKLKGPDRFSVIPDTVAKMARIGGWEAPKKIAATTPEGKQVTWEDLVGQSYKPVAETEKAA